MQITADVYGRQRIVPSLTETTAFGDMFMAMLSLGLAERMDDVRTLLRHKETVHPNPQDHSAYQGFFEKYMSLYQKIEEEFG
jgi:sugar (pentulose or hexulose) kinase